MKISRLCIVLIAALAMVGLCEAAGTTANVSWSAPTSYTDGSALPASDIASYTVTWTGATAATSGSVTVASPALTATATIACGSASFTVSVKTSATALYPNAVSAPTSPVPYATGVTCGVNPPTGVQVK